MTEDLLASLPAFCAQTAEYLLEAKECHEQQFYEERNFTFYV